MTDYLFLKITEMALRAIVPDSLPEKYVFVGTILIDEPNTIHILLFDKYPESIDEELKLYTFPHNTLVTEPISGRTYYVRKVTLHTCGYL